MKQVLLAVALATFLGAQQIAQQVAQQAQLPPGQLPGDVQFRTIHDKMAINLMHLPNYTCIMTVDRSETTFGRTPRDTHEVHQDTIRLEVAEVDNNELFGWPGGKLSDAPLSEMITSGLVASGDFAMVANVLFRTKVPVFEAAGEKKLDGHKTVAYAFQIAKELSRYAVRVDSHEAIVPYHGWIWADPDTNELRRMEFDLDAIPRDLGITSSVTVIDYQKVNINGADFLLPARVVRKVGHLNRAIRTNVTTFTNCRQYGTESSIKFDAPEDKPSQSATPAAELHLDEGVQLPMKLETAMEAGKAAIGDPLIARLTADVHVGDKLLPAGSEVRGRISMLRTDPRTGEFLMEMEFSEVRAPGIVADFHAFLESMEKRKGVRRQLPDGPTIGSALGRAKVL